VDVPLPQDDPDALALFFWVAYTIKSLGIRTTTYPRLDVPISQYKLVAAQLRLSAVTLLGLNLQFGEVIEGAYQTSDVHTDQAEQAAAFCDEIAATLIQLKAAEAPLIVKRNYGSREARGYVRMLAIESRSLFGKTLLRTLATVGSVALMKDVKAGQVRNWCGSLD
jgi:phosphoglycolate phosphatase-like HAD superfamily hydrolase